jgi:2-hydroxymuconate-semialdehyde hydrolase
LGVPKPEDSHVVPARERVLAGLPVTPRRLQVAGRSTALLEGGDGEPLVLLHGGIECGGAIWAPVITELARGHRLVIPDVPGLGESEPATRLDPAAFASWLDELIQLTCDERPMLVAHSLVANYAARFAAERGDGLRRLVIYAAPGIGPYRMPLALRVVAVRFALRPTARNSERFESFALLDRQRTRDRDREWFDAFSAYGLERARVPHVKRTMNQLVRSGTRRVSDEDLSRISIPVGVVWGRSDRMTPLRTAADTVERLGWPVRVIEDAAHVPHLEQPERFLAGLGEVI